MKSTLTLSAMALLATAACSPYPHGPAQKSDAMFALIDTNHDGVLTTTEWAAFGNAKWAEADTNRDGVVSKPEFDEQCRRDHDAAHAADRDGRPVPPPAPAPYAAAPAPYSSTTTTYAPDGTTTTYAAPAYVGNMPRTASTVRPASEGYGRNEATVNGSNDPQSRMPYARTHN